MASRAKSRNKASSLSQQGPGDVPRVYEEDHDLLSEFSE